MDSAGIPILLGVANRVLQHSVWLDLLGVTVTPVLPVYPQSIGGLVLVLAIPVETAKLNAEQKIRLIEQSNTANHAWIGLKSRDGASADEDSDFVQKLLAAAPARISAGQAPRMLLAPGASHVLAPIPCPPLVLQGPTHVDVVWECADEPHRLGELRFGFFSQAPIEEDERQALLADPSCIRVYSFELSCPKCGARQKVYDSLVPDDELPSSLTISAWRVSRAADSWTCRCGAVTIQLCALKASTPYMFRNRVGVAGEIDATSMYQNQRLSAISTEFRALLDRNPAEQEVQTFLESHSIFWNFLSPRRILVKPRVLTHATADFGVLSNNKILYLVEIERPDTRLIRERGGRHHAVQRALDQTADWREVVRKNLPALLDELGLPHDSVRDVRFVVIAGRDTDKAASIRMNLPDDTTFLTFMELAAQLVVVQSQLAAL